MSVHSLRRDMSMSMSIGTLKVLMIVATIAVAGSVVTTQAFDQPLFALNGHDSGSKDADSRIIDDTPAETVDDQPIVTPDDAPTGNEPAGDGPAGDEGTPAVTPGYQIVDISGMTEITGTVVIGENGSYYIDGRTISSDSGPAISVTAGEVLIVIKGNCTVTSDDSDAIRVYSGAKLTIQDYDGESGLTVRAATVNGGGSGIGYQNHSTGDISIIGMGGLSAYGKGANAFGIGGVDSTVTITDAHITEAIGGSDTNTWDTYATMTDAFGKNGTGGPGIGGRDIEIAGSEIDLAVGGPKGAGIGAIYHTPTSVSIIDSVIHNALGGTASAGIGGSRQESGNGGTQTVDIYIKNSDITATGGEYGAGIGAGYDTHCQTVQGLCTVVICDHSVINATGGKYAAGIGTAYHMANLAGSIDDTVDITNVHCGQQKNSYSVAQDIGYGVIDASRDGLQVINNGVTFTVAGTVISGPVWY